ncbi:MAG: patatin-like phospholipase family protein [Clostridia bacterium]|nr:patatin-like phospholipase family protein [Clostridia bacterium]
MWFFRKRDKTKPIKHKKVKIGFALGGGGARGIGHIGALMAFEELGIFPDFIVGTSAGSIVGALYSYGLSSKEIADIAYSLKKTDIKKKNWFFMPSSTELIEATMLKVFKKNLMFSELKIPFSAMAVNIKTGKEVKLDSGFVAKACCASSAVPGVFKPVEYDDMVLVDGGLTNNVPADIAREMGANVVFAIDVNPTRADGTTSTKLFKVLSSTLGVMMQENVQAKSRFADILITLKNVPSFTSSKVGDINEMIQAGYDAVMDKKEEILNLIKKKPKIKDKIIWRINTKVKSKKQ